MSRKLHAERPKSRPTSAPLLRLQRRSRHLLLFLFVHHVRFKDQKLLRFDLRIAFYMCLPRQHPTNDSQSSYNCPYEVQQGHGRCTTSAVNRTYSARRAVEICIHQWRLVESQLFSLEAREGPVEKKVLYLIRLRSGNRPESKNLAWCWRPQMTQV